MAIRLPTREDSAEWESLLDSLELDAAEKSCCVSLSAALQAGLNLAVGGHDSDSILSLCGVCNDGQEGEAGLYVAAGLQRADDPKGSESYCWQCTGPRALKAAFLFWRRLPESPLLALSTRSAGPDDPCEAQLVRAHPPGRPAQSFPLRPDALRVFAKSFPDKTFSVVFPDMEELTVEEEPEE